MNYDEWKTGFYEAEPEINYDEHCSHNHKDNREALKDLIEALYADNELNVDFIKEQLQWLADDYNILFDSNRPLRIEKKKSKDVVDNSLFDMMITNSLIQKELALN